MHPSVPPFAENAPIPGTKQLVVAQLATGAHGAVYLTRNRDLPNKLSVIKILHADLLDRIDLVDRLRQEAALLAAIEHPNIVSVTDAGMTSEAYPRPYFQMEYLRGKTLRHALDTSPRGLGYVNAVGVAIQLCGALDCAHTKHGVVHRDLKPENVFLQEGPDWYASVKLVDFGVARVLALGDSMRTGGRMIGTPEYMSPEQIEGKTPGPKSDLYGLGLLLYEMLSGRAPFADVSELAAVCFAHLQREPPRLSAALPDIDPELERLVSWLLLKPPEARPKSASWLEMQLRAIKVRLEVPGHAQSPRHDPPLESPMAASLPMGSVQIAPAYAARSSQAPDTTFDPAHAATQIGGSESTATPQTVVPRTDPMPGAPPRWPAPQAVGPHPQSVPPPATSVMVPQPTARSPQALYQAAPAPRGAVFDAPRPAAATPGSEAGPTPVATEAPSPLQPRMRRSRKIALATLALALLVGIFAVGMAVVRQLGKSTTSPAPTGSTAR